jgi:TorA maturation chaperone TorD
MMSTAVATPAIETRERAIAYRLFGMLLSREVTPTDSVALAALRDLGNGPHLSGSDDGLLHALAAVAEALPQDNTDDVFSLLAADYAALFLGAGGPPSAPPFQSGYRGENRVFGTAAAEMRQCLHELKLCACEERGPEDHIAIELTVMATLIDQGDTRRQLEFLEYRLLNWVPQFVERVRAQARQAFYPAVASALEAFLHADIAYARAQA